MIPPLTQHTLYGNTGKYLLDRRAQLDQLIANVDKTLRVKEGENHDVGYRKI